MQADEGDVCGHFDALAGAGFFASLRRAVVLGASDLISAASAGAHSLIDAALFALQLSLKSASKPLRLRLAGGSIEAAPARGDVEQTMQARIWPLLSSF